MCRHRQVAGPLPASFHHVDFGRPAAVICEHPEGRPYTGPNRYLRTDLEISILLRKPTLGRQDARYVFIVEEHRLQCRRCAGCNDRENSILNFERVEPKRSCCSSAIAWINIYLLFAVVRGFPFEVGAISSPVARLRPGSAPGVVRHPLSLQQWMLVEIIVKGPVQGNRRERSGIRRLDATASFAERIARNLQGQPYRRSLEILLRKSWREGGKTTDHGQDFRRQLFLSSIGSMIDRQAFLRRDYTVCSFVLSWTLQKKAALLAAFFVASCGFTRTGAGDHHIQRTCPNPDHRNGNAERKTRRWCPRPWRHMHRCCRTVPMPWRLHLHPASAVRHSEHLHWDGRTRTRPAPGSPPARTPALRSSSTGLLPHQLLLICSSSVFCVYQSVVPAL